MDKGNFSRAWIVFHQSNSIFNKLDFALSYSNFIVQPSVKIIHMELNVTDSKIFTQFSHVLTSSSNKIGF